MAISAATVMDVRSTGSDTNGGGFVTGSSGTDFSKQDAPAISVADAVANGTTTITSATASFGSTHPGNLIYVQGGTGSLAASWRQVVSVTNATTIVVDATVASGTGITLKLGGAFASPGQASAVATVSGNVIQVKSGSYSFSATNNVSGGRVTLASGVSLYGYETTRYDVAARPVFNAAAASMTCVTGAAGSVVSGVEVTNTGANASVIGITPGTNGLTDRCKVTGCATGFNHTATGRVTDCEAVSCTVGFAISNTTTFIGCKTSACASYAFQEQGASIVTFVDCLAIGTTAGRGFSISASGSGTFANCLSRGHRGVNGRGFELGNRSELVNCRSEDNTDYGFYTSTTGNLQVRLRSCSGYNNLANTNSPFLATMITNLIACSADPSVDAVTGDYRLNSVAGGGLLLRGTGWPQAYPGLAAANAPDIGPYQSAASGTTGIYRRRLRTLGV